MLLHVSGALAVVSLQIKSGRLMADIKCSSNCHHQIDPIALRLRFGLLVKHAPSYRPENNAHPQIRDNTILVVFVL